MRLFGSIWLRFSVKPPLIFGVIICGKFPYLTTAGNGEIMALRLKEVHTNRDLSQFINFPLKLYRNNPYYVPGMASDERNTLDRAKNPAFKYCEARYWLAYKDGRPVGRIAGIFNPRHNEKWNAPYIRFGWMDFEDDPEVSAALLSAVEAWGREKGLKAAHGPLGFSDLDREALLIEGFDEVATLATLYNYPYYADHMERLGYRKDTDWVEYELSTPEKIMSQIVV